MAVKRYDGTAWQTVAGLGAQGPAATSSSIVTWVRTIPASTSTVSGAGDSGYGTLSYTAGQELVYLNGVLQDRNNDYTANNGTSIVFTTALATSDVVTVWTVNAFSVSNAINNSIVTAKGDLIGATGSGAPAQLAVGANGQVLTASSTAATGLTWSTPSSAALTKIAKTTFSGATSASFNDVFSSTYVNYRILIQLDSTSGNNQPIYFRLRVSGSDAATNYTTATSYSDGGDIPYGYRNLGGTTNFRLPEIDNDYSNEYYSAIDLFCPQLARKTGYLSNTYSTTLNGQPKYEFTAGTHTSATSYTGFSLVSATGNIAGTVWIYGYQD